MPDYKLHCEDSLHAVKKIAANSVATIVSDGAYGLSLFDGDTATHYHLAGWYADHIASWSRICTSSCTLWFWNTEIGWASTHATMASNGWAYRALNIWDKGLAHVAGRINTPTLSSFPVVTEVCAQYVRTPTIDGRSMQSWMRGEWARTRLPLHAANEACGVGDAASRKYLCKDKAWYLPPARALHRLVVYANKHGCPDYKPFFAVDGLPLTFDDCQNLQRTFNCPVGVTNVWRRPALRGAERLRDSANKLLHANQKPLDLVSQIIEASTNQGDLVMDPFMGTGVVGVACANLGRRFIGIEKDPTYFAAGKARIEKAYADAAAGPVQTSLAV